ncbi:MAG TPA: diacylglycerol kinase [Steroidobacteraceae bacterium]
MRCRFAIQGLAAGLRSEHSLRYQMVALACVVVALIRFRLEPLWWAIVALSSAAVISAELFNTALEFLADHLHPQIHPQIRLVKDCAAAAVLVAACGALAVAVALAIHLLHRT